MPLLNINFFTLPYKNVRIEVKGKCITADIQMPAFIHILCRSFNTQTLQFAHRHHAMINECLASARESGYFCKSCSVTYVFFPFLYTFLQLLLPCEQTDHDGLLADG